MCKVSKTTIQAATIRPNHDYSGRPEKNPPFYTAFHFLCGMALLTIDDTQTIVYVMTADQGMFLNSGPDPKAFGLQAIIDDYKHCEALSPPDTVRMDQLLAYINENY